MLAFIGGVFVRSLVYFDNFFVLFGLGMLTIVTASFWRERTVRIVVLLCATVFVGAWWYAQFEPHELKKLAPLVGQSVDTEALVEVDPQTRESTQRLVVVFPEAPREQVLVTAKRYPAFAYGDTVRVRGTLREPENFSEFDYVGYLAKDDIYFTVPFADVELLTEGRGVFRGLYALKHRFAEHLNNALAFPHSAFVNGILLGDDTEMPQKLKDAFIATGMSHVTALSGYNITVVIVFVVLLLSAFVVSRRLVLFTTFFVIAVFVVMTGASSSVVRAAVMGCALLLARQFGRQRGVLNILVFAAFVMVVWNPRILVDDIGFQLSFCAVLGLAYLAPILERRLTRIPEFLKLKESFISTISAQAAVLPLVLVSFHQFSIVAPLVNVLVLPLIPLAMLFGFAVGVTGFVSAGLAQLCAYPLWLVTAYQLSLIEYFAQLSYAAVAF